MVFNDTGEYIGEYIGETDLWFLYVFLYDTDTSAIKRYVEHGYAWKLISVVVCPD